MATDKELSSAFIQGILENENINSITLARELGCTKGFISSVKSGRSPLPKDKYDRIIDLHPSFAKYGSVEGSKIFSEQKSPKIIKVKRRENSFLTKDYVTRSDANCEYIIFDKVVIQENYSCDFSKATFEIVTIPNDALNPKFHHNDNIIIDTSIKTFVNGFTFAFIHNSNLYINEITVICDGKYKSTDINDRSFSFLLEPDTKTEIIGLVVPKIRF